ncbi:MAG: tetratricopeptide repeat protein [Caldilineaceae bacterium]
MTHHNADDAEVRKQLEDAQRFYARGQFANAVDLAKTIPASSELAWQAQLLHVRCLFEQGRYREAEPLCAGTFTALLVDGEPLAELHLWCAALQIYLAANPTSVLEICKAILAQSQPGLTHVVVVAEDWLARALALQVEWGLATGADLSSARQSMAETAEHYLMLGDLDSALGALIRLGKLYRLATHPDRAAAQPAFARAQTQAQAEGNLVRQAEALLCLAELNLDEMLAQHAADANATPDLYLYQQAFTLYQTAGHVLGPADVLLSLGRRFIDAGFDGAEFVQQALATYEQENYWTGSLSAMSALATWHLRQGRLAQAFEYYQKTASLAAQMGFVLGQATATMGLGDFYFRNGEYARALAYYEQVEALAGFATLQALVGLNLANTYTLMNLPERAERLCRTAIARLQANAFTDRLSLAYFILGNVLAKKDDWSGAMAAWRDGLQIDQARQDRLSQAEKLISMAQATTMQYYKSGGPSVPEAAYAESMALYEQALALLAEVGSRTAEATMANTYQLQGQTALTHGRLAEAVRYLEQARDVYATLDMGLQTANTDAMLGLLLHELGRRGQPDFYPVASEHYSYALTYYQQANMRDMAWKVCFYLAHTAFRRGLLAMTGAEQCTYWQEAARWLEEAATSIEFVRGRFVEPKIVATESARLGLVADKEKVYTFAVQLHYHYLRDHRSAFAWLERFKGRVFLDSLALTSVHLPAAVDETLAKQESTLRDQLRQSTTQVEAVNLSEQLHTLWQQMALEPAAREYVALRRGEPVSWAELQKCLHLV